MRAHGGSYTEDKWLSVEVPQDQWVKGLPVKLDHKAMFRHLPAARTLITPDDYKPK